MEEEIPSGKKLYATNCIRKDVNCTVNYSYPYSVFIRHLLLLLLPSCAPVNIKFN